MNTTLQKKRQATKKGLHIFNNITSRKRKQRASTTANPEDLDEVPNFGITSVLVVILLLHVVAIAAIFFHNKFSDDQKFAALPVDEEQDVALEGPKLDPTLEHYRVNAGETYEVISRKKNLRLDDLRRANQDKQIEVGMVINLPILKEERVVSNEPILPEVSGIEPPIRPTSRPTIQHGDAVITPNEDSQMVRTRSSGNGILLKPRDVIPPARPVAPARNDIAVPLVRSAAANNRAVEVYDDEPPARTEPVRSTPAAQRTHTVRRGDTIYRLSRKYGVSQNALMRSNGIRDPSKMRLGMTLRIPQN